MNAKISISVLLMVLLTSLITVMGQEQTDKKKQEAAHRKQEQITIIMDSRKDAEKDLQKAMTESLEAEEKALKSRMDKGMLDSKTYWKESQALQEYKKQLGEMKVHPEVMNPSINYSVTPSMRFKMADDAFTGIYNLYGGEREGTSLSISKSLEDVTISTDFFYDVKEESSNVNFFVTGTLKAGELKITLKKPDTTTFQEITISPLADVNWNQQFRWDEDESDEYLGKWIISISANKANGNYRVQVNSR